MTTQLSAVRAPIDVQEPLQHVHRGDRRERTEQLLLQPGELGRSAKPRMSAD
jgi:hypothetical protein